MKKNVLIALSVIAVIILAIAAFFGYQYHLYNRTIVIDSNCRVFLDDAGNALLLTSEDGKSALLIDTKKGKPAEKLAKKIGTADLLIVNTHAHFDHTEGNSLYDNTGIVGGSVPPDKWKSESNNSKYPTETLQPGQEKIVTIGTETVRIRNTGAGHTCADLIVYFEKRKLLAAGDLLFPGIHPVLYPTSGGEVASWVRTLDSLIADTGITTIVPGHGLPTNRKALAAQREYFNAIAQATERPDELELLRKKYRNYYAVPGLSSFDMTVDFIMQKRNKH